MFHLQTEQEVMAELVKICAAYGITEMPKSCWMYREEEDNRLRLDEITNPTMGGMHATVDAIVSFFEENPNDGVIVSKTDVAEADPQYDGHEHRVTTVLFADQRMSLVASWENTQIDPSQPDLDVNTFLVQAIQIPETTDEIDEDAWEQAGRELAEA